jgi:hypothetical protein
MDVSQFGVSLKKVGKEYIMLNNKIEEANTLFIDKFFIL